MNSTLMDEYYWLEEQNRERLKAAEQERLYRLIAPTGLGGRAKLRLAELLIDTGHRLKQQVESRTIMVAQE